MPHFLAQRKHAFMYDSISTITAVLPGQQEIIGSCGLIYGRTINSLFLPKGISRR
jgi:hypothetical protein